MKYTIFLTIFLLSGCFSAGFCVSEGKARFSVPFDFPKSPEQKEKEQLKLIEEQEVSRKGALKFIPLEILVK